MFCHVPNMRRCLQWWLSPPVLTFDPQAVLTLVASRPHVSPSLEPHVDLCPQTRPSLCRSPQLVADHERLRSLQRNSYVLLSRITKVRQFQKLALLSEADGHLQQKLKQLLKLSKEKWDSACDHGKTAVQVGT